MRNIQTLHITVQRGEERPSVERCVKCCSLYHCPFCVPEIFKPTSRAKCWKHLEGHKKRAVRHKDYLIYKCNLKCSSVAHFHCVTCTSTFIRREWFIKHLKICEDRKTKRKLSEVNSGENSSQKGAPLSRASGVRGKDCADISKTVCKINTVQNPRDKQLHITVQRGEERPIVERCVKCCSLYHCPFCVPEIFKPTSRAKCWKHLEGHKRRAVRHKDYLIYKCNLKCSSVAHFHCVTCTSTFVRREWFIKHLKICGDRKTWRKLAEVISGENSSQKDGPLSGATGAISANSAFEHLTDFKSTTAVVKPLNGSSARHTPAASPLPTCTDSFVEKGTLAMPGDQEKEGNCCRDLHLTVRRVNEEPLVLVKSQECGSLYHCLFCSPEVFKPSECKDEVQRHLRMHCGVRHEDEQSDTEETLVRAQRDPLRNAIKDGFSLSTDISYGNTNTCCTETEAVIQTFVNQLLSEHTSTENAPPETTERKRSSVITDLCPWCGLELNRKNLLTHIRRKHPKETDTVQQDKRPALNGLRCPVCSLSLLRKNLPQHIRRKHPDEADRTVKKLMCRKTAELQQLSQLQTMTGSLKPHILDSIPNSQTSTTSASAALQHFSLPFQTDSPASKPSHNLPKVQCPVCAAIMLKKNLSVHVSRKHNKN